jgi:hypothetical protein
MYYTDYQVNASISAEFIALKEAMQWAIAGNGPRFLIKSGHEMNLLGHLAGLRLINAECIYYRLNNSITTCAVS